MNVRLAVLTPGRWAGKAIPVPRSPFLIGRDPGCHLRPSSPAVGPRQCALLVRAGKVFVRELGVSAGTFINGREVQGEQELHPDDRLEVGPLAFGVQIDAPAAESADEEAAAALLLEPSEGDAAPTGGALAEDARPVALMSRAKPLARERDHGAAGKPGPAEPDTADVTAAAARAILLRYRHKWPGKPAGTPQA